MHSLSNGHSAFDYGWTYGPITYAQHVSVRRYADAIHAESVRQVPGYWINPPYNVAPGR